MSTNEHHEIYLSIDGMINLLKKRGLIIENVQEAKDFLQSTSYASLIPPYASVFYNPTAQNAKTFFTGTTFDEICELYNFDRKIRTLFFEYILIVEHKLKTLVSEYIAEHYGSVAYWDASNFTDNPKKRISKNQELISEISAQDMLDALKKQLSKKTNKSASINSNNEIERTPIWEAVNAMTLGDFRNFYQFMKQVDREKICYRILVWMDEMDTCLYVLNNIRNACAHDEPIYNYRFNRKIHFGKKTKKQEYHGIYAAVKVLKLLLPTNQFLEFYSQLNTCLDELFPLIHTIPSEKLLSIMGFTKGQKDLFAEIDTYDASTYHSGLSLTDSEFLAVVSKYIMPILYGEQVEILSVHDTPAKDRAALIKADKNCIYFSQAYHSRYSLRAKISYPLDSELLDRAELHLKILLSNIQIVWNSNKARVLSPLEKNKLFLLNIEIAYQLSICILLCNLEKQSSHQKVTDIEFKIRSLESSTTPDKTKQIADLQEILLTEKAQYRYVVDLERKQQETLYGILSCFDEWSQKTYEGKHMPFGIIVNRTLKGENTSFSYHDFLQKNYSATISDGSFSSVEISADGRFVKHSKNIFPAKELYTIPYPYQGFAAECVGGKIGIILTGEGDILIISEERIIFSKHSGQWKYNLHSKAIEYIKGVLIESENKQYLAECIMQTLIDLSYSHGGACIAIANSNPPNPEMLRLAYSVLLDEKDRKEVENRCCIPEQEKSIDQFRISVLNNFTQESKMFNELNTNLRRELLEMDGALLMGCDGKIYAVAAIVKLNGSSNESGARTTAALQLSEYGLAIKVSQDGYMKFYSNRNEILTI